jgi:hypothetical protein
LQRQDLPLMQAVLVYGGLCLANLAADLLYGVANRASAMARLTTLSPCRAGEPRRRVH